MQFLHMWGLQLNWHLLLVYIIATQTLISCHKILKHTRNNSATVTLAYVYRCVWLQYQTQVRRTCAKDNDLYTHTSQLCPFRLMRSQPADWRGYGVTSLLSLTLPSSVSLRLWLIGAEEGTQGRPPCIQVSAHNYRDSLIKRQLILPNEKSGGGKWTLWHFAEQTKRLGKSQLCSRRQFYLMSFFYPFVFMPFSTELFFLK